MVDSTASGNWAKPIEGTGHSQGLLKSVGLSSAAILSLLTSPGTGSDVQMVDLQRSLSGYYTFDTGLVEATRPRTPNENLARIEEILSPAVTNLAEAFGVARQTIYNWRNGEPVSEGHAGKLQDLAQAADVFSENGVTMTAALLKRRFAQGKTLFQVVQAGESARDAAVMLATILKREEAQRARLESILVRRTKAAPASEDFDLPHADLG